jgi:hypothetical protein
MEHSCYQKLIYGIRHRIKEKGRDEERKNKYEIKTGDFKQQLITVGVRDCIT